MIRTLALAGLSLAAFAGQTFAGPPADIDACIKLSADTARAANANTEAKYVKFHMRMLDLDMACGQRDYVAAEKLSAAIKAEFHPDK